MTKLLRWLQFPIHEWRKERDPYDRHYFNRICVHCARQDSILISTAFIGGEWMHLRGPFGCTVES